MTRRSRRTHSPAFKGKVALAAIVSTAAIPFNGQKLAYDVLGFRPVCNIGGAPMITRMVVQTTISLAAMGIILFVAAGDWGWPQGWAFLGEIAISSSPWACGWRDTIRLFSRHASPRRCSGISGPGTASLWP